MNFSETTLLSSFRRYFHYTTNKKYKIEKLEYKKTANILCYIFIQQKENEILDEVCKVRNNEYSKANTSNDIIFKPIFVLKYLNNTVNLNQRPFYNIISVKQFNEIDSICNLPDKRFIKKDYQARRNINFVCGGYIRKIIHDIKGLSEEQKKEKLFALKKQLNNDCINKIKEECRI